MVNLKNNLIYMVNFSYNFFWVNSYKFCGIFGKIKFVIFLEIYNLWYFRKYKFCGIFEKKRFVVFFKKNKFCGLSNVCEFYL